MEIDEMPVQPVTPEPQIILNEQAQYYLQKAGQWAYFLGIMGFVGTAFIAIMALFVGTIFTTMATINPMMAAAAGMGGLFTVIYLLIALISFFFALYLYQFGDRIKKGITYKSAEDVTIALSKLKSFFKLWGVFTVVYLSFVALMIIISILGGAAGMMNR
ncbi:hypothetical protein ABIB62_001981 [Mucilaginibacter sp. UYP25]|uniref:DUF5362 family protein n=1 Tax=unclassified Mucilaginibacter TaxID=2617802 RepID=UPI00339B780D